jgi:nucleotide-binding universal stress UspA family protein
MKPWNDISCAIDSSRHSWQALERAVELARPLGARLTLLHVLTPPFPRPGALIEPEAIAKNVAWWTVCPFVERWRRFAEHTLGRAVDAEVLMGDPARELGRYATEHQPDLLVVGTRGPAGLGRLLLGSVAERVIRDLVCPVMVVHFRATAQCA